MLKFCFYRIAGNPDGGVLILFSDKLYSEELFATFFWNWLFDPYDYVAPFLN